jgi:hypothetical protein
MKWWDWDSEEVLAENDVTVEWGNELINGEGEVFPDPWGGSWVLSWKQGVIDLGYFGREYEEIARIGAAIFVTLWLKRVPVHIADKLAGDYIYLEWQRKQHKTETFSLGGGI